MQANAPTSRVLSMLKNPRGAAADELHSVASFLPQASCLPPLPLRRRLLRRRHHSRLLPQAQRFTDFWDHDPADGVDNGAI